MRKNLIIVLFSANNRQHASLKNSHFRKMSKQANSCNRRYPCTLALTRSTAQHWHKQSSILFLCLFIKTGLSRMAALLKKLSDVVTSLHHQQLIPFWDKDKVHVMQTGLSMNTQLNTTRRSYRLSSAAVAAAATGDVVVQRRLVDDLWIRCCQLVYRCF